MDMELVHAIEKMLMEVGFIRDNEDQPIDQGPTLSDLRPVDKERIVVLVQELVAQVDASCSMNQALTDLKQRHVRELAVVNAELKALQESYDQLQASSKSLRKKSRERALESLTEIRKKDDLKYKTKFSQMKERYENRCRMLSEKNEDLELRLRMETVKKHLGSMDADTTDLRKELLNLREDEAMWKNEKMMLDLKLKKANAEIKSFVSQVDGLDANVTFLSKELTEKNVEINKLTANLENEKLSLAAAKAEIKEFEVKMNDYKMSAMNKYMSLGDQNTTLKTKAKAAKVELQTVVYHMEESANASSAKCRALEKNLHTLKRQAQNELSAANRKIEELKDHTDGVTLAANQHKALEDNVARLQREVSEREADIELMKEKYRSDRHAWHMKVSNLKRGIIESENQFKRLYDEKELLRRSYESKLKDNTKQNEELLAEHQKYRQALEIEMNHLKEAKEAFQARLLEEKESIISQQNSLDNQARLHDKKSVLMTRDLQQSYMKLESLLKQEREANKSRVDHIINLERKVQTLTGEIVALNDKMTQNNLKCDRDCRTLQTIVHDLQREKKTLEKEVEISHKNNLLSQAQTNGVDQKHKLNKHGSQCEDDTQSFRSDELASLKKTKRELTESLAESVREKQLMVAEIRNLQENEMSFKCVLERRNKELEELSTACHAEKRALQAEIKQLKEDVNHLRKKLNETEMEESKEKFLLISEIKSLEAKEKALRMELKDKMLSNKNNVQQADFEHLVKAKAGAETKLSEVNKEIRLLSTHVYRLEEKHDADLLKLGSVLNNDWQGMRLFSNSPVPECKGEVSLLTDWDIVPHIKSLGEKLSRISMVNHQDYSSNVEKLIHQLKLLQYENKTLEDRILFLNKELQTLNEKFASDVASHEIELGNYKKAVSSLTDANKKLEGTVENLNREKMEVLSSMAHDRISWESKLKTLIEDKQQLQENMRSLNQHYCQQSQHSEETLGNYQNEIQALKTALNQSEPRTENDDESSGSECRKDSKAYLNSRLRALEDMFCLVLKENLVLYTVKRELEGERLELERKYKEAAKSIVKLETDLNRSEMSVAGCKSSLRELPAAKKNDRPHSPPKSGKKLETTVWKYFGRSRDRD